MSDRMAISISGPSRRSDELPPAGLRHGLQLLTAQRRQGLQGVAAEGDQLAAAIGIGQQFAASESVIEEPTSGLRLDTQIAEAPGQRVAEEADAIDAPVAGHRLVEEGHARCLAGDASGGA